MVEIRRPKKPYEEHRREFAAARGMETNQGEVKGAGSAAHTAGEARVAAPAPPAPPEAATEQRHARPPSEEKLRLKFTVHAPIPGASAWFDQAVQHMGEDSALRLVLAKAFDQLEAAVAAGEAVARGRYAPDPLRSTNTSRHVSAGLYARGKAALDPMELLPPGTFGRQLAMSALARLLASVG
jgi:hypothetical protein